MRAKPLKTRGLILSLSKDEAKISAFFSILLEQDSNKQQPETQHWGSLFCRIVAVRQFRQFS
jgi:hypothetical protein